MNPEEYNIGWVGNVEQPVPLEVLKQRFRDLLEVVGDKLDVPFDHPSRAGIPQITDWLQLENSFRLLTLDQLRTTLAQAEVVTRPRGLPPDEGSLENLPEVRAWRRMKAALVSVSDVLLLLTTSEDKLDPELHLPTRLGLARKLVEENLRKDLQLGGQIVVGSKIYTREQAFGQVASGSRDAGNIVKVGLYFGKAVLETSGIDLGLVRR